MKQIFITTLLIAFLAVSKNAFSIGAIVASNCHHITDEGCLTTVPYQGGTTTSIKIDVDFSQDRDAYFTDWWVNFRENNGTNPTDFRYERGQFYHLGGYKFRAWHHIKLPPEAHSCGFITILNDENNNPIDVDKPGGISFHICEGYYKQSNSNLSNHSAGSFDEYKVYPNPIENDFSVEFRAKQREDVTFQVFDIEGRSIYLTQFLNQEAGFHSKQIDNLNLKKGIYFCKIHTRNLQKTIKVTKL